MSKENIISKESRKTRVYISSTTMDLGEYRTKAVRELLSLGLNTLLAQEMPMALPGISDFARELVRLCDVFVAIIGARSGFIMPDSNITVTEYEMKIAQELGRPILCYMTRDSPVLNKQAIDIQPVLGNVFSSKVIRFISTPEECSRQLIQDILQVVNRKQPPDVPTKIEFERIGPSDFKTLLENSAELISCSPRKFEEIVAELLKADGWDVELVLRNNAPGPDIIAVSTKLIKDIPLKMIVECKRWSLDQPIDVDVVRKVMYWVNEEYNTTLGMIATTSRFTSEAIRRATNFHQWRLTLKDRNALLEWIKHHAQSESNKR